MRGIYEATTINSQQANLHLSNYSNMADLSANITQHWPVGDVFAISYTLRIFWLLVNTSLTLTPLCRSERDQAY